MKLLVILCGIFVVGFPILWAQDGARVEVRSVAKIARQNPVDVKDGISIASAGESDNCSVTVWQFKTGIAQHYHKMHDEVIYCEQGRGIARIGNELMGMKAGDYVIVPRGIAHGVTVTSKETMRGISVFSPRFDGKDRIFLVDPAKRLKIPQQAPVDVKNNGPHDIKQSVNAFCTALN